MKERASRRSGGRRATSPVPPSSTWKRSYPALQLLQPLHGRDLTMRDLKHIAAEDDARLIPIWSIVIAIAAFVGVEYYFWMVLPDQRHHPGPPLGFRIYFNVSWGLLASLYFLMVGYVSKDAPRRSMSAR